MILADNVTKILETYNAELEQFGVECKIERHNFKLPVIGYLTEFRTNIFSLISREIEERREKTLYKGAPNRYKVVVIKVCPLLSSVSERNQCKQYAFYVEKVERVAKGVKPKYKSYQEEKLVKAIENRLKKLLKKAEKESSAKWCFNNVFDALRYLFSSKYGYMKTIFGKDPVFWDLLFTAIFVCLVVIVCVVVKIF